MPALKNTGTKMDSSSSLHGHIVIIPATNLLCLTMTPLPNLPYLPNLMISINTAPPELHPCTHSALASSQRVGWWVLYTKYFQKREKRRELLSPYLSYCTSVLYSHPLMDKTAVLVMGPLPLRGPLPNHKTDSFINHLLPVQCKTVNPNNPITLTYNPNI